MIEQQPVFDYEGLGEFDFVDPDDVHLHLLSDIAEAVGDGLGSGEITGVEASRARELAGGRSIMDSIERYRRKQEQDYDNN